MKLRQENSPQRKKWWSNLKLRAGILLVNNIDCIDMHRLFKEGQNRPLKTLQLIHVLIPNMLR